MDRELGIIARTSSTCGAILIALLSTVAPAHARTTIVPDDFPTIQAAVDNIAQDTVLPETLLVRGGSYPERVQILYRRMVLQAIPPLDGSDRMPEIAGLFVGGKSHDYAFIGLHFTDQVYLNSWYSTRFLFAACRFDEYFYGSGRGGQVVRLTRCTASKGVLMGGHSATLDSSAFHGPVFMNADSAFVLDNQFDNIEYRAVTVTGGCALVARNRVRGGGGFDARTDRDVRFEDNDIEGCRSGGIDSDVRSQGHAQIERNRIAHCGTYGFDSDGIKVQGRCTVRGNLVLDGRGPGIHVDHGEGAAVVEDNVVGRCDLAGISLTNPYAEFVLRGPEPATTSVRGNTVYGCVGPGIEITSLPGSAIANNLVCGGVGLAAYDSDPLRLSHNDWFPESGEAVSPTDLSVDPLFCDLSADDVHLRSDSPLLDVAGVGRIGALGQGCEAPIVAMGLEMWPRVLQPASRARWVTAFLEPPSEFTLADVDLATVRLNDVPVAQDTDAVTGDQDRDRIPDLQLRFDREAIERTLTSGEQVTVTVTGRIGRRNFAGTDQIRVLRDAGGPRSEIPRNAARDHLLSIHAPQSPTGLRVEFTLAEETPARLEVLDVAGRVVSTHHVGSRGPGEYTLDLAGAGLAQGIYFLRLRQGVGEARTRMLVVR